MENVIISAPRLGRQRRTTSRGPCPSSARTCVAISTAGRCSTQSTPNAATDTGAERFGASVEVWLSGACRMTPGPDSAKAALASSSEANSSGVRRRSAAGRLSASCCGVLAPTIGAAIAGFASSQATATARQCRRPRRRYFVEGVDDAPAGTRSRSASPIRRALLSGGGWPGRYLPVRKPPWSGLYGMTAIPSRQADSRRAPLRTRSDAPDCNGAAATRLGAIHSRRPRSAPLRPAAPYSWTDRYSAPSPTLSARRKRATSPRSASKRLESGTGKGRSCRSVAVEGSPQRPAGGGRAPSPRRQAHPTLRPRAFVATTISIAIAARLQPAPEDSFRDAARVSRHPLAVDIRRVEEVAAGLTERIHDGERGRLIRRMAERHRAKTQRRNLEVSAAKSALLHSVILPETGLESVVEKRLPPSLQAFPSW